MENSMAPIVKSSPFWEPRRGGGKRGREEMIQKQLNFEKQKKNLSLSAEKRLFK